MMVLRLLSVIFVILHIIIFIILHIFALSIVHPTNFSAQKLAKSREIE